MDILIGIVVFLAGTAAYLIGSGFAVMLMAGALHHDVHTVIPAFNFWQSILVAWALTLAGALFNATNVASNS